MHRSQLVAHLTPKLFFKNQTPLFLINTLMTDMEEGEEFLSVCNTHISDEQQGDGLGSWAQ